MQTNSRIGWVVSALARMPSTRRRPVNPTLLGSKTLGKLLSALARSDAIFINPDSNLAGADLSRAMLSGANLSLSRLTDADLSGADLSSALLTGADLVRANLARTSMKSAQLARADLLDANLSDAALSDADLSTADLTATNLSGAILCRANLVGANLNRATLTGAISLALDPRLNDVIWSSDTTWPSQVAQAVIERRSYAIGAGLYRINPVSAESHSDSAPRGVRGFLGRVVRPAPAYDLPFAEPPAPPPPARPAGVGRDDDDDGGEGALIPV